jgi:hypothetical protein
MAAATLWRWTYRYRSAASASAAATSPPPCNGAAAASPTPPPAAPHPISEEKPVEGSIELTQDLPTLRTHWGIELEHVAERKTEYRCGEIKRESEGMGWTVFVERDWGALARAGRGDRSVRRGVQGDAREVRRAAFDRTAGGDQVAPAAVAGVCEFEFSAEHGRLGAIESEASIPNQELLGSAL